MEVINDLLNYRNFKIYQNTDWFSFSLDSVLLANFVTLNNKINTIIDLGCGNAPIPLILSTKTDAKIIGVEIQKDCFELAKKSVIYNNLTDKIELLNMDMKKLCDIYDINSIDVITCNPPYFKYLESSNLNDDEHKIIARHEKYITLEDIVIISKYLLKTNGVLAMVHRTERVIEIIKLLENNDFAVKKMQFVYPKVGKESNMVLIEARKSARDGLKLLPPLYVHNDDGSYTKHVKEMFE